MKMRSRDLIGMWITVEDLDVGKVKEVVIDTDTAKVTHLEVELTRAAAEQVIGKKKRWIRNNLAVSAIEQGSAVDSGAINLKITKNQLRTYLSPPTRS